MNRITGIVLLCASAVVGQRRLASDDELEIMFLTNRYRAAGYTCPLGHVYPPNQGAQLVFDCRLWAASYKHSMDMQVNKFFSHSSSEGLTYTERRAAEGTLDGKVGENIIRGWPNAEGAMRRFMKSDEQCKLIMDPTWTVIGAGMHYRRRSRYLYYWTQMFGTSKDGYTSDCVPRTTEPTAVPTEAPTRNPTDVMLLSRSTSNLPLRCAEPALQLENHICHPKTWRHTAVSQSEHAESPMECQVAVIAECENTEYFTWRASNLSCHCVENATCDAPTINHGLNVYKTACAPGCLEPTVFLEDHICHDQNWRHTAGSQTDEADTPAKCQESVIQECAHTAFFSFRASNASCHCLNQAHCDSPARNPGLTVYRTNCIGVQGAHN